MSKTSWYRRKVDRPERLAILALCMTATVIGWVTTNAVALAEAVVLPIIAAVIFVPAIRQKNDAAP